MEYALPLVRRRVGNLCLDLRLWLFRCRGFGGGSLLGGHIAFSIDKTCYLVILFNDNSTLASVSLYFCGISLRPRNGVA